MKNRRFGNSSIMKVVFIITACFIVSSCSRPQGDFGRAKTTFSNDTIAPRLGDAVTFARRKNVSLFSRTDEELKLENLTWTIVRPVHTKDWISGSLIETRRTGIFPDVNRLLDYRAYLFWHRIEPFISSEARWNRIITDIRADQGAVTPFYDQARLVYAIDQQRFEFLEDSPDVGPLYRKNTKARLKENEALIKLALDSFHFRYLAYEFAIKRLALEFPSARVIHAKTELSRYGELIERGGERGLPFLDNPELLSSRIRDEEPEKEKKEKLDGDEKVLK